MRVLQERPSIDDTDFVGESLRQGERLPLLVVDESEYGYDENMAFWRSLGESVRPSLLYKVGARMVSTKRIGKVRRVLRRKVSMAGQDS
jgi:hypothetical protein